jgi:hypothetical protein
MKSTQLYSIGYLSQLLQTAPERIRVACGELGIKPATIINGVEHFSARAMEQLRAHFAKGTRMSVLDEIRRLEAENRRLKQEVANKAFANEYLAAIGDFMADGLTRAEAVREASRQFPDGRNAFLKRSNRGSTHHLIDGKQKIVRR